MNGVPKLSNTQARRIALRAQGFTDGRPQGRIDRRHFRRVLHHLRAIQLDSVNVLVRAHYLPFFSRLGPYQRGALDSWTTESGELFEYWGHGASLLPVELYPLMRFRMREMAPGRQTTRLLEERPGFVDSVYEEVVASGPLTVSQLSDPGRSTGPWWGRSHGKIALEWLFATGAISAVRTPNFGRLYDIPARVIPDGFLGSANIDGQEAHRQLLQRAAAAHGIATAGDLADYYRLSPPKVRPALEQLVRDKELLPVEVQGWPHRAYLHPAATRPRRAEGTSLLSPFDSLVWTRERVERLFGFRYRIEIYVPQPQRQHGYYVLPFLLHGALAARVDLKADRQRGRLLAKGAFVEDGQDRRNVASALWRELTLMADWLGLDEIEVGRNGDLASELTGVSWS